MRNSGDRGPYVVGTDKTTSPVLSKGSREHAVVPGSLRLGEVISTELAEKIPFEMRLIDGRTLRGRIGLRVLAEDSLVKVYPSVIILGVDHARDNRRGRRIPS